MLETFNITIDKDAKKKKKGNNGELKNSLSSKGKIF
jgi:hypothetical protein